MTDVRAFSPPRLSYARKIDEISRQRDARSDDFDGMVRTGKELVSKKDVTDTAPVKDKIKVLTSLFIIFKFIGTVFIWLFYLYF